MVATAAFILASFVPSHPRGPHSESSLPSPLSHPSHSVYQAPLGPGALSDTETDQLWSPCVGVYIGQGSPQEQT